MLLHLNSETWAPSERSECLTVDIALVLNEGRPIVLVHETPSHIE